MKADSEFKRIKGDIVNDTEADQSAPTGIPVILLQAIIGGVRDQSAPTPD